MFETFVKTLVVGIAVLTVYEDAPAIRKGVKYLLTEMDLDTNEDNLFGSKRHITKRMANKRRKAQKARAARKLRVVNAE